MPDAKLTSEWTSGKIVLIYIIVGCLWILLSDKVLVWFSADTELISTYQTYKGSFYVLATAAMLYALIDHSVNKIKNSENSQQLIQKRYQELIENAKVVIYTLDLNGRFTSINNSAEKFLGYSCEEILKLNFEDIVTAQYKTTVQRSLALTNGENSSVYNATFIKKNGNKILLEVSSHHIFQDGNTVEIQGIVRDMAERRFIEESLEESETRYRNLIETANEGIVIVDSESVITFVNQKFCEMIDYDSEELLGSKIYDFMNDTVKTYSEQKIEYQKTGFQERFDFKFRKLGGGDVWTSISASPIFKDGEYVGSLGMITDITERKLAEDELLKVKSLNDSMIDSLPGIFYLYDKDGKFLRWNKNFELVSGCSAAEMEEMHPLDFFAEEEKPLLDNRINEVFEEGESSVEANFVTKDGTKIPYFFTGKRIMMGDLECLVGMGIDISKRK